MTSLRELLRPDPRSRVLVLAVAAALLAGGQAATAAREPTPLTISPARASLEVGDTVEFALAPRADAADASYANADVVARYGYHADEEGADPSDGLEPRDNDSYHTIAALRLDADSRGAFEWTVPQDAQDRNVAIVVEDADGALLARADVVVGAADESGDGGDVDGGEDDASGGIGIPGGATSPPGDDAAESSPTPVGGPLILIGGVALVALLLRRRE